MEINEFNIKLGKKLTEIRENFTDMSQEEFYKTYLASATQSKRKKGSTIQSFMKEIENGYKDCPHAYFPIYAKIAGITIDDLVTTGSMEISKNDTKELTYSDVAVLLDRLIKNGTIRTDYVEIPRYGDDTETVYAAIINDGALAFICREYETLRQLQKVGTIKDNTYDSWEKGFLSDLNVRLLRYSDPMEIMEFEELRSELEKQSHRDEHLTAMKDTVNGNNPFTMPFH